MIAAMDERPKAKSEARLIFRILAGAMAILGLTMAILVAPICFTAPDKNFRLMPVEMLGGAIMFGAIATRGRRSFFD